MAAAIWAGISARQSRQGRGKGGGLWLALLLATALPAIAPAVASAQANGQQPRLEDLIPDSAVADPEGWAAAGVAPSSAGPDEAAIEAALAAPLDTPLAPENPLLADITLDWPDNLALEEVPELAAEEPAFAFEALAEEITPLPPGRDERIARDLVLVLPDDPAAFPEEEAFVGRFRDLSSIAALDDGGNIGQLAAQARADEELLIELLRVYGYFNGQVIREVGAGASNGNGAQNGNGHIEARFVVLPGQRYRFGAIDLGNIASAGRDLPALRAALAIEPGDPLSLDAIAAGRLALDTAMAESGYPFARIEEPALLVDHERAEGDLSMPVEPGGRFVFGVVTSDRPSFLSSRHLARMARFDAGDLYRRSEEADLRQAILATGLVRSVNVTPVATRQPVGEEPGVVDMVVNIEPGPVRTLAAGIGFGTGEGLRLEGSWEHRNLFPPEGGLRLRAIAGTREQLAGITFRRNNFRGRDRILTADLFASTISYDAYDARTVSLVGSFEQISTALFQKPLAWSAGFELVATAEAERDVQRDLLPRQTYLIAALPLAAQLDNSDDLLDPTSGWRAGLRLSPEVARNEGVQSFYLRSQFDASYYRQVSENVVLAGRVRLASIPGAPVSGIAPSRRLYAGGGGSVRGYGFRQIGPLNDAGDPIGGRSLTEFSLEARVRTGLFDGALGIVPFVDAGTVGADPVPGFAAIKFGAGIGLRYETGFGPLRVDVAVPLNRGPNDGWVAVYVALGQAF